MSYNPNSGWGRALINSIASVVPAFGRIFVVVAPGDLGDERAQRLRDAMKDYNGVVSFFSTVEAAYAAVTSNNNDVILLDSDGTHALSAMLTVAKNRVHFFGMEGGVSRRYGQRAKVSLGVTTAATDLGTILVTGVGCTFRNTKFMNSNTVAQGIYCFLDGGEYTYVENCEIYKETDLDVTGAAELVLNGDSSHYKNCTFGSLANAISGTVIRPCITVTAGLAGTGKVLRDVTIEDSFFWRKASHINNRYVYGANATDVERMLYIKNCLFFANKLSVAAPAQCVAFGAEQTQGYCLIDGCTSIGNTKLSTTTGVYVAGPVPTYATTGIAVAA